MSSRRRRGRLLPWLYLCIWVIVLIGWAWSTGWRTYLIEEDVPVITLITIGLIFICWLNARNKDLLGP